MFNAFLEPCYPCGIGTNENRVIAAVALPSTIPPAAPKVTDYSIRPQQVALLSSVYASLCTSRYPAQDSRPSGSLFLSRKALSSSTSCRFSPAHCNGDFSPIMSRIPYLRNTKELRGCLKRLSTSDESFSVNFLTVPGSYTAREKTFWIPNS